MKLFDALSGNRRSSIDLARRDYLKILGRRNAPHGSDAERMIEIQRLLGLTDADLTEDAAALDEATILGDQIDPSLDPATAVKQYVTQADSGLAEAMKSSEKAAPRIEKLFAEATAARQREIDAVSKARTQFTRAHRLEDDFDRICLNHAYLFGGAWPEDEAKAPNEQTAIAERYRRRSYDVAFANEQARQDVERENWEPPAQTTFGHAIDRPNAHSFDSPGEKDLNA